MISLDIFAAVIFLLCTAFYTSTYAVWTWKKKNKLGAIAVFILVIATLTVPVYEIFFRD